MCFSIPYKIKKVNYNSVILEDGTKVIIPNNLKVKKGEYLRVSGNIVASKLSSKEGLKQRKLIKSLYEGFK